MKSDRRLARTFLSALMIAAPVFSQQIQAPDPTGPKKDPFEMDLETLLNMKVSTASKFSEKLSDAPGVMSVVTQDELRRFGGITLREILERVPGLAGTTASFTDRNIIAARGDQTKINGGHILFLINGRPTREILEGGMVTDLMEAFPVNILERIEVIRGPGSVLYGSNAFSAVVNLITQKAEGTELVMTGMGGDGKAVASSGQFMIQRGGVNIVGATQFHQKPSWSTPVFTAVHGVENPDIPDRGKGAYLGVNYKGLSVMSAFTESATGYIEGEYGVARWRRGFADLGYHLKPNDKWDMSFNLTYSRNTFDAVKFIPFIDRDSSEVVLEWTNTAALSSHNHLTFGALYNHIQGVENFYSGATKVAIADGSRNGSAFYAQLDHEFGDKVKAIAGFQANKIGRLDLSVVPRVGLIWTPASRVSLKVLYSRAFRAPSINEILLNYSPPSGVPGPSLLGNPDLLPEKVATVDVGLSYQGTRFQGDVDFFHSKQTNSIILDAPPTLIWSYVNLGEAMFHGVELAGKYYLRKSVFLTGSFTYQANEDSNGNSNITPIPNASAKAGISYASPKALTVSLFNVFQGGLDGYDHALNPQPAAYNLLNANFRYDLAKFMRADSKTGFAFVAHADNLVNKAVWMPDWKDAPGDSTFSNRGRTVYFGIELTLKKE